MRVKGTINTYHLWPDKFKDDLAKVDAVCSPDRLFVLWQLAKNKETVIEVGVAGGGSAKMMHLSWPIASMHLYDTFEGIPVNDEGIPTGIYKGTVDDIHELLPSALLFKGKFEERKSVNIFHSPVLIHVDTDLVEPTRAVIDRFWSMMKPGDIMVFDDYNINLTKLTELIKFCFPDIMQFSYAQGVVIKT
jgi:hypothetical protein|tara:strand:- start:17601 stop:18170 length:570 start_codon:yes stop_codon:yes gene_type:complete